MLYNQACSKGHNYITKSNYNGHICIKSKSHIYIAKPGYKDHIYIAKPGYKDHIYIAKPGQQRSCLYSKTWL